MSEYTSQDKYTLIILIAIAKLPSVEAVWMVYKTLLVWIFGTVIDLWVLVSFMHRMLFWFQSSIDAEL